MKKLFIVIALLFFAPFVANAQNFTDPIQLNRLVEGFSLLISISFAFYLASAFIITILKMILDYRLKEKMIDKGVSESLVIQFLEPSNKEAKNLAIKWFFILSGIGIGLLIISFFRPFGIHSIIIMVFSTALGFLGYHFFTKRTES